MCIPCCIIVTSRAHCTDKLVRCLAHASGRRIGRWKNENSAMNNEPLEASHSTLGLELCPHTSVARWCRRSKTYTQRHSHTSRWRISKQSSTTSFRALMRRSETSLALLCSSKTGTTIGNAMNRADRSIRPMNLNVSDASSCHLSEQLLAMEHELSAMTRVLSGPSRSPAMLDNSLTALSLADAELILPTTKRLLRWLTKFTATK